MVRDAGNPKVNAKEVGEEAVVVETIKLALDLVT